MPLQEDGLKDALRQKQKQGNKYLSVAAKLLAPVIEADIVSGFNWMCETLRSQSQLALATGDRDECTSYVPICETIGGVHVQLRSGDDAHAALRAFAEMEIAKALYFMRSRQFDQAIETLKSYEKKDKQLVAHAATNLSFIYFHEGDYQVRLLAATRLFDCAQSSQSAGLLMQNAVKYADLAMKHNRYNAKALVNKGNCMFVRGEYDHARSMYQEAMGAEADCLEAIYNLGKLL